MLSIVVPTYNEKENVEALVARIENALTAYFDFEIIFIDDKSTDGTFELLGQIQTRNEKVSVFSKVGKRGKAFSLVQGFAKAKFDLIAMIDADLQYPPEEIFPMVQKLREFDVLVADRKINQEGAVRKLFSKTFRTLFGQGIYKLNVDIQSGLKVFKKEVISEISFTAKSGWTFDLEFLRRAHEAGFKIGSHDIEFAKRVSGKSKVSPVSSTVEVLTNATSLKATKIKPVQIEPNVEGTMLGAGVGFKGKRYVTHTTLKPQISALENFFLWQKIFIFFIIGFVSWGLATHTLATLGIFIAILSFVYFIDVIFNLYLIIKSLHHPPTITSTEHDLITLEDSDLPIYTILCPLYKESDVLPNFLFAIDRISWPKEKLDVILLFEQDDSESLEFLENTKLPSYVRALVVPDSLPKTKPKACNYGLGFAKGEFLVIYDAEDIPDPWQLKKAYLGFGKVPRDVVCLQAKLNYHNVKQNILTRLFTAEYSLWFDVILMGLQSLKTNIPLGGTSNHFPTEELRKLQGWDPFNVTEDADLGVRLFKAGYKTAVIDSITLEEANSEVGNWIRQRSRWLKGYMQTYLVHMRHPVKFIRDFGVHAFIFQLTVGGKIAFMFINPILWLVTLLYFPLFSLIGPTINSLYPTAIFYMAITSLVVGNFMFMYYFMIGCAKREHWQVIKYVFLVPFYWLLGSIAAVLALHQLIFKPHFWEKTRHGLNVKKVEEVGVELQPEKVREQRTGVFAPKPAFVPNVALPNVSLVSRLSKGLVGSGSILVIATIFANFLNFIYSAYLTRTISYESFGLITLINSFLFLTTIPLVALSRTVAHRTAFFLGKYDAVISGFWRLTRKKAIVASLGVTALWLALSPFLASYFQESSLLPFIVFAPIWIIGTASAVDEGFISGNQKFEMIGFLFATEAMARLVYTWLLINFGFEKYVYNAIPASILTSFLIGWIYARRLQRDVKKVKLASYIFPTKFLVTSVFVKISIVAFISLDVILAKHFLPPEDAGKYAILSLAGKMIYFVGSLFSQFITPLISKEEGKGEDSKDTFNNIFILSALGAVFTYVAFGFFGQYTAPIFFGEKAIAIVEFLPVYGMAILMFTVASNLMLFHQTRSVNMFPIAALVFSVAEIFGIMFFHSSILEIVNILLLVGFWSLMTTTLMHVFEDRIRTIIFNIEDFLALFRSESKIDEITPQGLNVLIFNWRDLSHKWAGGAEVYTQEIAKKLTSLGHNVTIFCGNDGENKKKEKVGNITVIRRGGFYMVYFWAILYYLFRFRGKYDLILDCENGIPFFTPLYAKEPVIGLVHHVHQEVFRTQLSFPFSKVAQFLEGTLMPFVYRNKKIVTVSRSSKEDLEKIGFRGEIEIVNPGVGEFSGTRQHKTLNPTILYLGRLKPYKSIDVLITAFSRIVKSYPDAKLIIAGEGESENELKKLVKKMSLGRVVTFVGKVNESQKNRLFSGAWAFVQPSMMEGWGISAIEANAHGTAVVASNVPGLRDSVIDDYNGLLVPWGDPHSLADALIKVISDNKFRARLERNALIRGSQFSWEGSAEKFYKIMIAELDKKERKYVKNLAFSERLQS